MASSDEFVRECFQFAKGLAKMVGPLIKDAFYNDKDVDMKSCSTDLVTAVDREVEKKLFDAIHASYPSHCCIGEETVGRSGGNQCKLTDEPTWIIDPIDGTTNFVHRFPYVAVCIGFTLKKQRMFGVVYNPVLNEMFCAQRGNGAYLNESRISVSKEVELRKSLVMTECGSSRDPKTVDKVFKNMQSVLCVPVHAIHCLGSAALNICMVARGGAEAYYEFGIHCWDFCAASVIVEEAGGVVVDTKGGLFDIMNRRIIAANNPNLAKELSDALEEHLEFERD